MDEEVQSQTMCWVIDPREKTKLFALLEWVVIKLLGDRLGCLGAAVLGIRSGPVDGAVGARCDSAIQLYATPAYIWLKICTALVSMERANLSGDLR
jgi:hypothetical protein